MDRRYFELYEKLRAEQTSESSNDAADAFALSHADQTLEASSPIRGEWRLIWPDGGVHWLVARFQVFRQAP
jgi:hypothetical protein